MITTNHLMLGNSFIMLNDAFIALNLWNVLLCNIKYGRMP